MLLMERRAEGGGQAAASHACEFLLHSVGILRVEGLGEDGKTEREDVSCSVGPVLHSKDAESRTGQ